MAIPMTLDAKVKIHANLASVPPSSIPDAATKSAWTGVDKVIRASLAKDEDIKTMHLSDAQGELLRVVDAAKREYGTDFDLAHLLLFIVEKVGLPNRRAE